MKSKTVSVLIKGTGNPRLEDADIGKGVTPADLKRSLNIKEVDQWNLLRRKTNETIPEGTDLNKLLEDHEKLSLVPASDLGGLSSLSSFFNRGRHRVVITRSIRLPPIRVTHLETPDDTTKSQITNDKQVIKKKPVMVIPAEKMGTDTELDDMGWKKYNQTYYKGYFRCNGKSYQGTIKKKPTGYDVYIKDPPASIFKGKSRFCFVPYKKSWYYAHFRRQFPDPVSLISSIQKYLNECEKLPFANYSFITHFRRGYRG